MAKISRRAMIAGSVAGVAAVTLGGGAAVASSGEEELTRSVLARLVGPVNLPPPEMAKLIAAVAKNPGYPKGYKLHVVAALERAGWAKSATARIGDEAREDFALLERAIMTELVVGTNYMTTEHRERDPLTYSGFLPCSSPFADLSMT